jgi:secondary thiamine-phosphate synthase enzyme
MYYHKSKIYTTTKPFDIIDITDDIQNFITKQGHKNGLVNVFTRHTTAVLKINEAEDGFRNDLKKRCDKNVSIDERYQHNDLEHRDPKTMCESKEECLNGHAHIRGMLMGQSSETLPVQDGKIMFGRRQRVLLFELDHAREREIIFSFIGD